MQCVRSCGRRKPLVGGVSSRVISGKGPRLKIFVGNENCVNASRAIKQNSHSEQEGSSLNFTLFTIAMGTAFLFDCGQSGS
jgi:hypothetical protein